MKRILFSVILAFITLIPISAAHIASIQPLVWDNNNHCTTFSINEEKGYWSTALHCVVISQHMMIAGQPATVLLWNTSNDTAVLVSGAHAPSLKLADNAPKPNDSIKVEGHPFGIVGIQTPFITTHGVFLTTFTDEDGTWNMYDLSAGGGNSGSPVSSKRGVIGTLNFGWANAGRLAGGTVWAALHELVDAGIWVN